MPAVAAISAAQALVWPPPRSHLPRFVAPSSSPSQRLKWVPAYARYEVSLSSQEKAPTHALSSLLSPTLIPAYQGWRTMLEVAGDGGLEGCCASEGSDATAAASASEGIATD